LIDQCRTVSVFAVTLPDDNWDTS